MPTLKNVQLAKWLEQSSQDKNIFLAMHVPHEKGSFRTQLCGLMALPS
jgi:hypothetical protein